MNVVLVISLCCLLSNAVQASIGQGTKLESLKSLIFNNAKTTVTLNSSDLLQLLNLSRSIPVITTSPKPGVAFSVYVKAKHLNIGSGQTVVYDGILTNEGNGYDDRTGVFTCPVAGTYMFVIDCLSRFQIWHHLKLNKDTVASLYGNIEYKRSHYLQMSRTVILKLKRGDHVKVVNGGNGARINSDSYSGFTGTFLL